MNIGSEIREEEQRQAQWKQSNYQREEPDEVKVDARAALIEKYHKSGDPILSFAIFLHRFPVLIWPNS